VGELKYGIVYADPPWWYSSRSANRKATKFGGGARAHYEVMKDKELLAMSDWVKSISDDPCVLFLWATGPRLDFATELLKAWGFRFATVGFVWEKIQASGKPLRGPGYYTGSVCEYLLIGAKGSNPPAVKMLPQLIRHKRLRHSEKPQVFRDRIEAMYPDRARIELFSRTSIPGWDHWGNEVGKFGANLRLSEVSE